MDGASADTAAPRRSGRGRYGPEVTARAEEALRAAVLQREEQLAAMGTTPESDALVDPELLIATRETFSAPAAGVAGVRRKRGITFWIALIWIGLVLFAAAFWQWLPIDNPNTAYTADFDQAPTWHHLFGTDQIGHDLFSQVVAGSRESVIIGLSSVLAGVLIGATLGIIAGFYRGFLDVVIVWFTDVLLTLPGLIFALTLIAFLGQSFVNVVFAIDLLSIPIYARIARGASFAISQQEFVLAGLALGARPRRILFREIMPMVALPILSYSALGASTAVLAEAALAFLGLGPANSTGWGDMISAGQQQLQTAPQAVLAPTIVLFVTILALNFLGQRASARLDTRQAAI